MSENVGYRGNLQPDRWKLHPEDFNNRMAWEAQRQAILDDQAESIAKSLPYPQEKIPPIPALRFPDWHLRHESQTVTESVTEEQTVTPTVTRLCEECGKEIEGRARYCSDACRQKAYRNRS